MGHVTQPRPFQGRFVICRLGLAILYPHTKFEMSTITCNEEVKCNATCENSRFEPTFGDLGVTNQSINFIDERVKTTTDIVTKISTN